MNKLTAEVARMDIGHLREHQANPHVGLSMREEKYLQALEIALPVLEQQEKDEPVWIYWSGEVALPPVGNEVMVEARMHSGNRMTGPAKTMRWRNYAPHPGDIVAYRVLEQQERERGEGG
ncbi:hypothetical protein [Pantoea sp. NGS-ED-1003]|uniref:hypothetical protein n=1 Tax=Pantoea sp. NGS-ED-1003 TaxID=1526743 RepID=UPI000534D70F|nr:hypothetical protein [Pantoea sp. NGS-ED-1003]